VETRIHVFQTADKQVREEDIADYRIITYRDVYRLLRAEGVGELAAEEEVWVQQGGG
jgi:hypothetical protein